MALVAVTACGSTDDPADDAGGSGGSETAGGDFPVTLPTTFGDVTVEEEPTTVVALGWGDAETALALEVQPVGASDWLEFGGDGVGPWAEGAYDESPEIIGTLEPEFERIAELDPDLILDVKSSGDRDRYDTLSKIATTVGPPEGAEQYRLSWEEQTRVIASALGRADAGEELIAEAEARFEEAAAEHPEFEDRTIVLGSRTGGGFGAYVRGTGRVDFVERLGFVNSPAVEEEAGDDFSIDIGPERLDLLDADLTVLAPIGVDAETVEDDPLVRAVPSVEDGRYVVFDGSGDLGSAFATDSILSVGYALEEVVPLFAERLG